MQTRPVDIFYTDNATDGIQGLRRLLLEPVTLEAVIFQLETPPTELAQFGVGTVAGSEPHLGHDARPRRS